MAKPLPKPSTCRECGTGGWTQSPHVVAERLASVVEKVVAEADVPLGDAADAVWRSRDAIWRAFWELASTVEVAVADLQGLCTDCCGKRFQAQDAKRAARRAARGAA